MNCHTYNFLYLCSSDFRIKKEDKFHGDKKEKY